MRTKACKCNEGYGSLPSRLCPIHGASRKPEPKDQNTVQGQMARKVTTGTSYPCNWPYPVGYYKWTCPECRDACEDPAHIWETCCHNGHIVKLTLTTDYAHDHMVAEYQEPPSVLAR